MEPLTLAQLDREADRFDEAVLATPEVDLFCSSTAWSLPAHQAFGPHRPTWIYRADAGYVALALGRSADGMRLLQPFEAAWAFASPLVGTAPYALGRELVIELMERRAEWDALLIAGLPEGSALFDGVVAALGADLRLFRGETTRRFRASLEGGFDGFLSRRSHDFRKNLRRARRRATAEGVTFAATNDAKVEDCEALYARLLAVESRSWKGREGVGIQASEMQEFYGLMMPRLARRQALRLWFARRAERDVGYILGGLFGGTYRGLQFSYDDELAHLSLGHLMQAHAVEQLCAEGVAIYDLGSDVAYKAHWGERSLDTVMIVAAR